LKTLIISKSIHHGNTEKIAKKITKVLDAVLIKPEEFQGHEGFDLIGFGSGIYHSRHHQSLFDLIDGLDSLEGKKVFVFSTAGMTRQINHRHLKEKLDEKNAVVIDEFSCKGFDTYSFLKYLGGINKGQPDEQDLQSAEKFGEKLLEK